jgi:hypothetical protein
MSKNVIFVLMYHRHESSDPKRSCVFYFVHYRTMDEIRKPINSDRRTVDHAEYCDVNEVA